MSYPPPHGPGQPPYGGYPPQHGGYYQHPDDYPPERRRRDDGSEAVIRVIRVVVGVVVTVFLLHVLFVVFDANQGNGFVELVYTLAKTFVLGLGDVFTPKDEVLGVALNYGLAALVYAVLGQLIIKAIRRR